MSLWSYKQEINEIAEKALAKANLDGRYTERNMHILRLDGTNADEKECQAFIDSWCETDAQYKKNLSNNRKFLLLDGTTRINVYLRTRKVCAYKAEIKCNLKFEETEKILSWPPKEADRGVTFFILSRAPEPFVGLIRKIHIEPEVVQLIETHGARYGFPEGVLAYSANLNKNLWGGLNFGNSKEKDFVGDTTKSLLLLALEPVVETVIESQKVIISKAVEKPEVYKEMGKAEREEELQEELNRIGPWVADAIKNNKDHAKVREELLLKCNSVNERVSFIETYARKGIRNKDRMKFAGLERDCQYSNACHDLGIPMKKTSRRSK